VIAVTIASEHGTHISPIKGPSVYFDVIFFTVYLYDEVAIISDIVIIDFMSTKQCDSGYNSQ
jgi:hypothetical protein